MESTKKQTITVEALVNAPIEKVWKCWTSPEDVVKWNNASADWHTTKATNDLRTGGKFMSRMEAKDGSMGFDFEGVYENVITHQIIEYGLADGRKVKVTFAVDDGKTKVVETFDPEDVNSIELQRGGWQAILDNFKKYVETN